MEMLCFKLSLTEIYEIIIHEIKNEYTKGKRNISVLIITLMSVGKYWQIDIFEEYYHGSIILWNNRSNANSVSVKFFTPPVVRQTNTYIHCLIWESSYFLVLCYVTIYQMNRVYKEYIWMTLVYVWFKGWWMKQGWKQGNKLFLFVR